MAEDAELMRALGRIEGKLDAVVSQLSSHTTEDAKTFHLHDDRIGRVERKQAWYGGGLAVVGLAVTAAWQYIMR